MRHVVSIAMINIFMTVLRIDVFFILYEWSELCVCLRTRFFCDDTKRSAEMCL